jgi:ubiquinone/menaquinone biosynthesis C-methylase UbiE
MLSRNFSIYNTQKNFSKVAWFYDYWGSLTESKAIEEVIAISDFGKKTKVLDIGVGTGQLFGRILEQNKSGLNYGIDLSIHMIRKSKRKFKSSSVKNLLSLADAFNLPFKNGSIDCIYCSYVLDLMPEKSFVNILDEFKRILNANGTGIIITMTMGKHWYNKIWYLTARYFPNLLTNCRPVDLSPYLKSSGLRIVKKNTVSQNTFPSEIIKFTKF